jgi:hypothetical protein
MYRRVRVRVHALRRWGGDIAVDYCFLSLPAIFLRLFDGFETIDSAAFRNVEAVVGSGSWHNAIGWLAHFSGLCTWKLRSPL